VEVQLAEGLLGEKYVPDKRSIHLTVNGVPHDLEVAPRRLLIDLLRYDLGLTGTKEGCSIGVCGACTVLLDGKMVSACLTLGVQADGANILTIEGLAKGDQLDPLQKAFMEHGGFQCGICTPGQIVAARALLNEFKRPTEADVKEWMMGNLCRCTGYYKIIESILAAAEEEAGTAKAEPVLA
jgi:aerobic carbon-monoxide dehydrogenase small subunit